MKTCKRCGETRPLADFHKAPRNTDGARNVCKDCQRQQNTTWRKSNPARDRVHQRSAQVKRLYGLSRVDLEAMEVAQNHTCAICHRPDQFGRQLSVDHCHITGAVRGLLCSSCNLALGQMQDSPDRLRAAAAYLDIHQSSQRRNTD